MQYHQTSHEETSANIEAKSNRLNPRSRSNDDGSKMDCEDDLLKRGNHGILKEFK